MPRYRYNDPWPLLVTGLIHGRGATVLRADGGQDLPGSTVELRPGDVVETSDPVAVAALVQLPDPAPAPAPAVTAPAAAPAPAAPAPVSAPAALAPAPVPTFQPAPPAAPAVPARTAPAEETTA